MVASNPLDNRYSDRYLVMQKIVAEKGGRILSKRTRFKTTDYVELECAVGHRFKKRVYSLLEGTWCKACHMESLKHRRSATRNTRPLVERLQEIAEKRGGRLISKSVSTQRDHAEFECDKGHRWSSPAISILHNDAWCLKCALQKRPGAFTIEDLHRYAEEHGGICHSTEYTRDVEKYAWECSNGRRFLRTWVAMRRGRTFCPNCDCS